jgi:hypothetical protein
MAEARTFFRSLYYNEQLELARKILTKQLGLECFNMLKAGGSLYPLDTKQIR